MGNLVEQFIVKSKEQARKDGTQRPEAGLGEKAIDLLAAHHRQKAPD